MNSRKLQFQRAQGAWVDSQINVTELKSIDYFKNKILESRYSKKLKQNKISKN